MNNRKNTTLALILVLALALVIYLVWASVMKNAAPTGSQNGGTLCAQDALQCADGSWVGRSGPNCQFVCPVGTSTVSTDKETMLQTSVGEEVGGLGVRLTPIAVVEDSRCPVKVQCIQAGTVRVRTQISSGLGTSEMILELDKSVTTETEIITLIAVTPSAEAGKTIAAKDYRLTFKVAKR